MNILVLVFFHFHWWFFISLLLIILLVEYTVNHQQTPLKRHWQHFWLGQWTFCSLKIEWQKKGGGSFSNSMIFFGFRYWFLFKKLCYLISSSPGQGLCWYLTFWCLFCWLAVDVADPCAQLLLLSFICSFGIIGSEIWESRKCLLVHSFHDPSQFMNVKNYHLSQLSAFVYVRLKCS